MWAHDLEKQQHAYSSGQFKPSKRYISKTASIQNDLPDDFAGGFPSKKGPVKIDEDAVAAAAGGGVLESDPSGPPLPPRNANSDAKAPPLPPR